MILLPLTILSVCVEETRVLGVGPMWWSRWQFYLPTYVLHLILNLLALVRREFCYLTSLCSILINNQHIIYRYKNIIYKNKFCTNTIYYLVVEESLTRRVVFLGTFLFVFVRAVTLSILFHEDTNCYRNF